MTGVLVTTVLALAAALVAVLLTQRRLAARLVAAGRELSEDVVPSGHGLAEATSAVERAVARSVRRGGDVSVAEARLTGALMAIPQGVVVFDPSGAVVFRNTAAAGYLTARHGNALVVEAIEELAEAAMAGPGATPARTVDLFGPPRRTLELRAISLDEGDRGVGALIVIDDVTDRRRLEGVRRDFISNISHELKTPVGALALLAETLVAEEDPAVVHRLAERMVSEAFRVGRTIDDLLELTTIEADATAQHEDVSIDEVVAEAVDRVRGAAEQRDITVAVGATAGALVVRGDRRQLVSAAYNLLDNAVKYSDGGSAVEVSARRDGRWIDLRVEDHGIGIPRRDLERIFERFYRVDRARSRETGGTGLGLAIVRHVASNHDGDVRVDSREGHGSTFTLRLPLSAGAAPDIPEAG